MIERFVLLKWTKKKKKMSKSIVLVEYILFPSTLRRHWIILCLLQQEMANTEFKCYLSFGPFT